MRMSSERPATSTDGVSSVCPTLSTMADTNQSTIRNRPQPLELKSEQQSIIWPTPWWDRPTLPPRGRMHDPSRGSPPQTLVLKLGQSTHMAYGPTKPSEWLHGCSRTTVRNRACMRTKLQSTRRSGQWPTVRLKWKRKCSIVPVGMRTNNVEKRDFHRKLAVIPTMGQ